MKKDDELPIYYIWIGGEMPEYVTACIDSWKHYMPDHPIIKLDETSVDLSKSTFATEAMTAGKYAFVADYIRCKYLYEHGGYYLDTDTLLVRNLEGLNYTKSWICKESNNRIGFGACKFHAKSKVLEYLVDWYEKSSFYNEDGTINEATITWLTNEAIKITYGTTRVGPILGGELVIHPPSTFYSLDWRTHEFRYSTDNSYGIHLYAMFSRVSCVRGVEPTRQLQRWSKRLFG